MSRLIRVGPGILAPPLGLWVIGYFPNYRICSWRETQSFTESYAHTSAAVRNLPVVAEQELQPDAVDPLGVFIVSICPLSRVLRLAHVSEKLLGDSFF